MVTWRRLLLYYMDEHGLRPFTFREVKVVPLKETDLGGIPGGGQKI